MNNQVIQSGSYSIIGDRSYQQDALNLIYQGDVIFASVCDGMGGMSGGELASAAAIHCMFDKFRDQEPPEERYAAWLRETFEEADQAVHQIRDRQGNPLGAGSTVVAVIIKESRIYWGSVGDSRIYYLNERGLFTVNRDHNYNLRINEMLARKEWTEEQAAMERSQGEALISFLGMGGLALIDTPERPILMQPGDILLLCSDGLYKSLNDQQIRAIIEESGGNMNIAARRLCEDALRLATAKQDNTTVIALRLCDSQDKDWHTV